MNESYKPPAGNDESGRLWGMLGGFLFVGGAIGLAIMAASPNGTATSQYINYDIVADRIIFTLVSAACFIAGAVIASAKVIINALAPEAPPPPRV